MKLYLFFCLIGFLLTQCLCSSPFSKCLIKQTAVQNLEVDVNNCEQKKRCSLKQNTTVKLQFKFTADKDYDNLEKVIFGVLNNGTDNAPNALEVPFGKKEAICPKLKGDFDGKKCEEVGLKKGRHYIYEDSFQVLPVYPKISLTVRFIIRRDNVKGSTKPLDRKQKANWKLHPGETLLCVRIPVKIV